jgi:hypothetical protein
LRIDPAYKKIWAIRFEEEGVPMMRVEVRSFQMPRWVVPVLVLAALALIPFVLALALAVGALALGAAGLRLLLSPPSPPEAAFPRATPEKKFSDPSAIDANYEVKGENEKDELH